MKLKEVSHIPSYSSETTYFDFINELKTFTDSSIGCERKIPPKFGKREGS